MIPKNLAVTTGILVALTLGMSLYLWQLRRHQTSGPTSSVLGSAHVAPPTTGRQEKVTLFVADDSRGELQPRVVSIALSPDRQMRALELLQRLVEICQEKGSTHAISSTAEIKAVYLIDSGAAVIDVNSGFVDGQTSGILAEDLTIASLAKSLSVNVPNVARVKILVDGKERDTLAGHSDISGFYDAAALSELSRDLSPK